LPKYHAEDDMLGTSAPKQTRVVPSIVGYLICCVLAVPVGSTMYFIGSGVFYLIADNNAKLLNPEFLMFEIGLSTLLTFLFLGFYPNQTGLEPINLWPWILVLGAVLFYVFRALIRRQDRKSLQQT